MVFGLLYGECFGPTGLVAPDWSHRWTSRSSLLVGGDRVRRRAAGRRVRDRARSTGSARAAGARALRAVRHRRDRAVPRRRRPGSLPGTGISAGWAWSPSWPRSSALVLAFIGLRSAAGGGGAGRRAGHRRDCSTWSSGWAPTSYRFARLAAFGLTHAVLGLVVWEATVGLWRQGGAAVAGAVVVFVIGNAAGVRTGGARRRHPGAAPRVLRAVLPGLPGRGSAVPAVARPDGDRPPDSPMRRHAMIAYLARRGRVPLAVLRRRAPGCAGPRRDGAAAGRRAAPRVVVVDRPARPWPGRPRPRRRCTGGGAAAAWR